MTNRFLYVKREALAGNINGLDFGSNLFCIARAQKAALLWSGGTSCWAARGCRSYGASSLIGIDRSRGTTYKHIGSEGGKLTVGRISSHIGEIDALFGECGHLNWLILAITRRETLLIEGGGLPFKPAASLGYEAMVEWMNACNSHSRYLSRSRA